jgi:hypothetical protein
MNYDSDNSEETFDSGILAEIFNRISCGMLYDSEDTINTENPIEKYEFLELISKRIGINSEILREKDFKYFSDLYFYVYENYYETVKNTFFEKVEVFCPEWMKNLKEKYNHEGFTDEKIKTELLDYICLCFNYGFVWCGVSAEIIDSNSASDVKIETLGEIEHEIYIRKVNESWEKMYESEKLI